MASQLKPIKVWGDAGPNPPKVIIILEELGLPHELVNVPIAEVKGPAYTAINPNGRLPSIHDPNTNLTLWESGAIVEYLIEKYDSDNKLSFPTGTNESFLAKQWLYLQSTGQGPYYGQAAWFKAFHHEKLPSAIERYIKEVHRLSSVLDSYLNEQKKHHNTDEPWLVDNKLTYADLSFVQWQNIIGMMLAKEEYDIAQYPTMNAWYGNMVSRPAIKKVLENAAKAYAAAQAKAQGGGK